MLHEDLVAAVRAYAGRKYELAHRIDVRPSTLSSWVNGIYAPPAGDKRVIALGEMLGVPPDRCFAARRGCPSLTRQAKK